MMAEPREIDRLIEEGLLLYGQGELDQALMIWEQALSIDPENPQANSYVDYVRMNYELLTNDTGDGDAGAGFGFDDEEPYKVEVAPGEIATAGTPASADPADEGWFIAGELSTRGSGKADEPGPEPPATTFTMEADEPPPYAALTPAEKPVSFDDQTREYEKGPGKPPEHLAHHTDPGIGLPDRLPADNAFAPEGTATTQGAPSFPDPAPSPPADFESDHTDGFGTLQVTDIRKRELGFVQPRAELPLKPPPEEAKPVEPELPQRPQRKTSPPELKMTLRTPGVPEPPAVATPDYELTPAGQEPPKSSTQAPTAELDPREPGPRIAVELAASQLVSTLPTPLRHARAITPIAMPPPPPIAISKAPTTRMMSGEISIPDLPVEATAQTREIPLSALPARDELLVSAPTRELGLRSLIPLRAEQEEPTKDLGVRKKAPSIQNVVVTSQSETRHDIVLPFDPIDARTAQILEDVDAGAPKEENKEDRTRRRITTLLDRAAEWSRAGEADKAVAAVDLALSEDPNAALAQKLLHRNRDAIMTIFQGYLGDLDRTPVLAKPLHELAKTPISPRAAFLLSRVDGALSIDEILDVSGMPRLEAYRYLCQLLLRGILR